MRISDTKAMATLLGNMATLYPVGEVQNDYEVYRDVNELGKLIISQVERLTTMVATFGDDNRGSVDRCTSRAKEILKAIEKTAKEANE